MPHSWGVVWRTVSWRVVHNSDHPAPLVVTGLRKAFDSLGVLTDVDLTVAPGATVALLGPSGCGKTTLLRAIAGLERPDSGTIRLGGRVLTDETTMVPPEKRRIGMVFQDWALFPHLDVAANVGYGLKEGREAVEVGAALAMVGLEGLGTRMPTTLSGGQQQRVAIARAIAPRPAVILLDEPFSNLDASLRVKVRSDTRRLLKSLGMTALFVTHDQGEAFVMGDEVAVMRDGAIRQQASPARLYDRPIDPWVARFVGEANLLVGSARGEVADTSIGAVPLETGTDGVCTLLVRPEQLRLVAGGDAEVVDVEFYGHDTSYRVAIPGAELTVRAMTAPRHVVGDAVSVRYEGPPAVVFPEESFAASQ